MLKQNLQQKLLQKLSPQQIQFIKLLQVPTVSLDTRIKEELEENPALEDLSLTNLNEPEEQYPDRDPEEEIGVQDEGSDGNGAADPEGTRVAERRQDRLFQHCRLANVRIMDAEEQAAEEACLGDRNRDKRLHGRLLEGTAV